MAARGFTLVEMAVVLVVIGLIMLTIFPALTTLRTGSQRSLTQTNLQALMRATATYVQAYGCLPCPTPPAIGNTVSAGFGIVRGDSSNTPAACGVCKAPEGIPPFVSLGIPVSTARDGWTHWISMRVDPALTTNTFNIVPPTAPCQAGDLPPNTVTPSCTLLGASQKGLCQSVTKTFSIRVQTPNQSVTPITQLAAVIFVSHGANGFGSFYAFPTPNPNNGKRMPFPPSAPQGCSALAGYAQCNADDNITYVDAPMVQTGDDIYDDMLAYTDRNTLISTFGNGSCQAPW